MTAAIHRGGAVAAGELISVGVSGRVVQFMCGASLVARAEGVHVGGAKVTMPSQILACSIITDNNPLRNCRKSVALQKNPSDNATQCSYCR